MINPKRYAVVGTGARSRLFLDAILGPYKQRATLVGMCDLSQTRLAYHNAENCQRFGAVPVPTYLPGQFDQMIAQTRPDVVLISTMDCVHHHYIIRALELGCDAVTEKPMTIDADKAKAILEAVNRTGGKLRVTFNYRYQPGVSEVKRLVMQGAIGTPMAVDFAWILDTRHGADYFRRWHREKDKSGGLLVHKASHHFDLINWWIDSYPQRVFAMGELKFYGRINAEARGESYSYTRYTGEPLAQNDPFALWLDSQPSLRGLYLDAEADSGYIRDRNVMGEPITIEDTMAVTARYRNGVILNYSLIAYSPWEGVRVSITGNRGRIEFCEYHHSHIITGQSDEELAAEQNKKKHSSVVYYPMFGKPQRIEVPRGVGAHGGGDAGVVERIFNPDVQPDPLHRDASHIDGAASILLGISANRSIQTGLPVDCDQVLQLPVNGQASPPRMRVSINPNLTADSLRPALR
jgi:predicted dehydrogenase